MVDYRVEQHDRKDEWLVRSDFNDTILGAHDTREDAIETAQHRAYMAKESGTGDPVVKVIRPPKRADRGEDR